MTANRTRENRLSGMIGGLAEMWARVEVIRAHNAETSKQTSLHLRLRALHFYPDRELPKHLCIAYHHWLINLTNRLIPYYLD